MLRKSLYITSIFLMCFVFICQNICNADITDEEIFQGHAQTWNAWDLAYKKMDAKYQIMENNYGTFTGAKSVVEKLNSIWNDHHAKLKSGKTATVENVTNAFITVIGAVIPGPGTVTTTANVVKSLPTAFATYSAAKSAVSTLSITFNMDKHQKALSASLSTMDGALSTLTQTHPVYNRLYNEYLQACANHILTRNTNFNRVYNAAEIDSAVNTPPHDTDGWYHGSESQGEHVIYVRGNWSYSDLPKNYPCEGDGGEDDPNDRYRTPSEAFFTHREKCGLPDTENVDEMIHWVSLKHTLKGRTVEQGCGMVWYSCDSDHDTKEDYHEVRECNKLVYTYDSHFTDRYTTKDCPESYRNCMGHTYDHNNKKFGMTFHSDEGDSDDDDEEASNDDDDDDDTEQDTQGLQTEQTQTSTPSYHACGVHATSVSGTHSAAGCGVSGHYVCDGSDHSLQASCTSTDSNGQYCTVSSFYACQSHTHVYPAPPAISCGRSGCTQTVSSSTAHQVTCSAGHQYWSCGQYATWHANHHRTRTCRFGRCGQSWQRCSRPSSAPTPMCADPTRSGERCWAKS